MGLASLTTSDVIVPRFQEQETEELRGPLNLVKPGFGEGLEALLLLPSLCGESLLWVLNSLPSKPVNSVGWEGW